MKAKPFSIYFLFLWLILFGFLPLTLILLTSFLSKDSTHLVTFPVTLHNYSELTSPFFLKVFLRSFIIAAFTTLSCLLLAYPFSYLLVKSRQQSLLLLLIIIPFWTSSLVRTYSLIAILKFKGILNLVLLKLHLIEQPLSLLYTNFAVISGLVYNLFPFMVLPIFTNMERFDFRLIEAAKDLGANKWQIFFRVFLPNTLGGIISGCLLVFLPAMTLFYIPNILGGARSILLGNMIQNQFLVLENWPQGAATSTILTTLLLLLLFFYRRHGKEIIH
ncbi:MULTISPECIES: ABC transporter permease [Legionella]|uniref:ABC transporter permease subunit n=1 Tax=Legionella septentrionalis TaxID=2498109 RepID=A0A433JHR6_9GAMM|nr:MULTISPECIES: ABC transporter permease subunit [Legionella]MCP0912918.1 ABC transporter permease subunit [Legionella sp. 27cVA30]RUQ84130.1 ABC transporter permease subunit [Legionella septentrionalis]RUQ95697.1 ABC transporter permease subunit [Legionella septentrionalis]RUR10110.1 ABC transporter permease subunit [Legionella septentrionalis]RUR15498.1 ABC transporter permease subunit [Legionella septentrionalis]